MHPHTTGYPLSGSIEHIMVLRRIFLIGLLLLALPLKGLAGQIAGGCGAAHHGATHHGLHAMAVEPHQRHDSWTTAGHAGSALALDHAPNVQTASASDITDADDKAPGEPGASAERCSACTPCGVALAPAPDVGACTERHLRAVLHAPRDEVHANPVVDVPLEPPRPRLI